MPWNKTYPLYISKTSPNFSYTNYVSKEEQAKEEFYDRL